MQTPPDNYLLSLTRRGYNQVMIFTQNTPAILWNTHWHTWKKKNEKNPGFLSMVAFSSGGEKEQQFIICFDKLQMKCKKN